MTEGLIENINIDPEEYRSTKAFKEAVHDKGGVGTLVDNIRLDVIWYLDNGEPLPEHLTRQAPIPGDQPMNELFDQPIDHDGPGFRLNVVSFTGNQELIDLVVSAVASFDGEILSKSDESYPEGLLAKFSDHDQRTAQVIATLIREHALRSGGICYAALRHSTGPNNNVDYLLAFE